jgi:hypothetical protein
MPDATALLFYLVALDQFMKFLDDDRWLSLVVSALAMALAILVKPTTVHLGLVLCILAYSRRGWRCFFGSKLLIFAAISLIPSIAYYAHAASIHLEYGNTFGVISGGDSKWGTLAWRLDPRFYRNLAFMESVWTVGPVGSVLALLGLIRYRMTGWRVLVIPWGVVTFLYYFIVARYAGHQGLGLHYHLFAAPLVALLTTGGFAVMFPVRRKKRWVIPTLFVLVFGYQGICNFRVLAMEQSGHLLTAGRAVAELSRPDDLILVLSEDVSQSGGVPNNFEQPNIFFHARRRGRALERDRQSREGIESTLSPEIRWFVNLPQLNDQADPSFHEFISSRMKLERKGQGFEIYSISTD